MGINMKFMNEFDPVNAVVVDNDGNVCSDDGAGWRRGLL